MSTNFPSFNPEGYNNFLGKSQEDTLNKLYKEYAKAVDLALIGQLEIIEGKVPSIKEVMAHAVRLIVEHPSSVEKGLIGLEYIKWKGEPIIKCKVLFRKCKYSFEIEVAYHDTDKP